LPAPNPYTALTMRLAILLLLAATAYVCGLLTLFYVVGTLLFLTTGHLNMAAYIPCFLSRIPASLPSVLGPPFVLLLITAFCLANLHGDPSFWTGWIFCLILALVGRSTAGAPGSKNAAVVLHSQRPSFCRPIYTSGLPVPDTFCPA
jgi:hypothetical protein